MVNEKDVKEVMDIFQEMLISTDAPTIMLSMKDSIDKLDLDEEDQMHLMWILACQQEIIRRTSITKMVNNPSLN